MLVAKDSVTTKADNAIAKAGTSKSSDPQHIRGCKEKEGDMAQPQLQQADGSQRRHSWTEVVDVGMRWGRQSCRSQKLLWKSSKVQR